ncbi:MAG: sensor histidine kinase [Ilyomonas sp.]
MQKKSLINDTVAKVIFIPLIGLLYPNVFGFINNSSSPHDLLIQYTYFIFVSFVVWFSNAKVIEVLKQRTNLDNTTWLKYITIISAASVISSGVVSFSLLKLWPVIYPYNTAPDLVVIQTTGCIIFISLFISIMYETYILKRKRTHALSKIEQLALAKTQAELSALKNQIDPHFIFNSLNTLSFLISSDAKKAKLFNDTLAKVYQYILRNKDCDLVLLREEIEFISNYFYLLKIRFHNTVDMAIEIDDMEAEELLIPPISLQTLVENAIKHNEFSEEKPLLISVAVSSKFVIVKNRINQKTYPVPTSKIGLSNLDNRYRLITKKNIQVDETNYFSVKLPIINLKP